MNMIQFVNGNLHVILKRHKSDFGKGNQKKFRVKPKKSILKSTKDSSSLLKKKEITSNASNDKRSEIVSSSLPVISSVSKLSPKPPKFSALAKYRYLDKLIHTDSVFFAHHLAYDFPWSSEQKVKYVTLQNKFMAQFRRIRHLPIRGQNRLRYVFFVTTNFYANYECLIRIHFFLEEKQDGSQNSIVDTWFVTRLYKLARHYFGISARIQTRASFSTPEASRKVFERIKWQSEKARNFLLQKFRLRKTFGFGGGKWTEVRETLKEFNRKRKRDKKLAKLKKNKVL